jgi:hypothetical protein
MPPLFLPPPVSANLIIPGQATVATLPPASAFERRYMWVTDLHDGQPDYVISDGQFWKPVRPLASRVLPSANVSMTLQALANAPTQVLRGTLTANRTVALSTANAYPGARFRIKREAGGLFGLTVESLGLLNGAGWMDLEYTGTGWVQTAGGGLLSL